MNSQTNGQIPILGFSAWSGTGKTTLLRQIIPALIAKGVLVSVIKHAHHDFDLDLPGKDSYELRKAGAAQTVICTSTRMAVMTEFSDSAEEPELNEIVRMLDPKHADLLLVEGYKHVRFAKIELHRAALGKPYLYPDDDSIVALACDGDPPAEIRIPVLDINNIEVIANYILEEVYRPARQATEALA